MASQQSLLVVVVVMISILHMAASSTDYLEKNNLPRGLIPLGVTSYVVHPNGHLEVTIPGMCDFFVTVDGRQYCVRYGSSFGGVV
uniref:Xylanase inhibitor C-terminal domain-containing protein n=1 Tax=Oryza barthii TaxID=65489 RepID=A0A0D3FJE4_9ORYZ